MNFFNLKNPVEDAIFQHQDSITNTKRHIEQILKQTRIWDGSDEKVMTIKNYKDELVVSKILRKINEKNKVDSLFQEDVLRFVQ